MKKKRTGKSIKAQLGAIQAARLEKLKAEHEARGDHRLVLEALYTCFFGRIPVPKWLSGAFMDAHLRFQGGKVGSWDDLFDRPIPKGAHREAIRDNETYSIQACLLCHEKIIEENAKKNAKPSSICARRTKKAIFEEVGEKLGFKKTKIEEWYYENKELYEILHAEIKKTSDQDFTDAEIHENIKKTMLQ